MPVATEREWITLKQASERFNVPITTLRYWRQMGWLSEAMRGAKVVVDVDEVRAEVDRRNRIQIRQQRGEGE